MARMGRSGVGQKPKNFFGSLKRILSYSKAYIPLLISACIMVVFSTICRLVGPKKLGEISDIINPMKTASFSMESIVKIGVFLIVIYVIAFFSTYVANRMLGKTAFKVSQQLRTDISHKINKLPLSYLDSTPYGDVLSRVTNDVDLIGQTFLDSTASLVGAVFMFLGSLLMMIVINPLLALCAVVSTLLGFSLTTVIIKKSQKYFIAQQKNLGDINGIIEESYSGQTVIRAYNAQSEVEDKFDEVNSKLKKSAWKSRFTSGIMQPIMGFVSNFGYVVVCIVGAILVIKGKIGFGVIVSFMIYVRLFTNPLSQIAQTLTQLQSTVAAGERVFEFLDEKELEDESNKLPVDFQFKGDVEFDDIRFGYLPDKEIIHGFSAKIKAGQKVALVGPTGAGKTTIVNLLMRFYELNSGSIKVDGVDINSMPREQLHELFGMVLQDTWLFEGTVKENLIYNKENVSDEELWVACKACGIDHFIKTLPHGLDTYLDDNTSISAGQKQLFTIARAMIQDSPMLILDEATSNVDTRTEELIQVAMDKLMEKRTSFVIAHRLSTIKNADLILVLNKGDVIEQGTHTELIEKNGFYAGLYNSQFL